MKSCELPQEHIQPEGLPKLGGFLDPNATENPEDTAEQINEEFKSELLSLIKNLLGELNGLDGTALKDVIDGCNKYINENNLNVINHEYIKQRFSNLMISINGIKETNFDRVKLCIVLNTFFNNIIELREKIRNKRYEIFYKKLGDKYREFGDKGFEKSMISKDNFIKMLLDFDIELTKFLIENIDCNDTAFNLNKENFKKLKIEEYGDLQNFIAKLHKTQDKLEKYRDLYEPLIIQYRENNGKMSLNHIVEFLINTLQSKRDKKNFINGEKVKIGNYEFENWEDLNNECIKLYNFQKSISRNKRDIDLIDLIDLMSSLSETNDDILVNNPIDKIIKNLTEQELGDENFINEFIKILEEFKNGLAEMSNKMSNNINPEKYNNELVAIIILCNKLEIDIINSETPEKRISIIKGFSKNLKKKINAIPDEYKTQVNKSEVVNLLEGFLSDISNARNRIKNNLPQNSGCLPFSNSLKTIIDEAPTEMAVFAGMTSLALYNMLGGKEEDDDADDFTPPSEQFNNKNPAPFTEKENPELLYTNMFINELEKYTARNEFIKELHQYLSLLNFDTIDKNTVDNFLTTFFGKLEEKLKNNSEEKDRNDIVFFYRVINNFIKKEEVNVQNSSKIDATNLDNDGDGLDSRLDISKMDYLSYLYNSSILPTISKFVEDLGQTINNNFGADKLLELNFYRSLEDIFKSFEINSQKKYHDILGSNQELKKLDINTNTINEITYNIRNVKDYVDSINQSENMFNKEHTSILKSLMNWFADTYNQIIYEIKRVDMETGITSGIRDWNSSFVDNTFLDDDELFKALEELHESIMTYVNKVVGVKIESKFRDEKTQELNEISIPENREIIVMRVISRIKNLLKKPRGFI